MDKFTNKHADAQLPQYIESGQKKIAGPLEKGVFKVVTPEEVVTPKEVSSSTQVFNSCFFDEIKNPGTYKDYEKSCLIEQAYNDKDKNLVLTQSPTIQQAYIQSISELNRNVCIQPPPELIPVLGASSDCSFKVMKPLHDMPEASNHSFAIYHPHYKDKLVGNPTRTFVCAANRLYFLCYWSNLSGAFFLAHDSGACTAEPSLVPKKGEPPRTSLHLLSHPLQPPSLLLGSTLSEMRSAMFKYSVLSKCATNSLNQNF